MKNLKKAILVMVLASVMSAGALAQNKPAPGKQAPAKQQPAAKPAPKGFNAVASNSIDKQGSIWVDGAVSVQSYSGDIDLTQYTVTAAADYFIIDHLGVGGLVSYSHLSNNVTESAIAIGPHVLYAFDSFADRNLYPFADLSLGWAQTRDGQDESGYFLKAGVGANYAIKPNLGLVGTLHYADYSLSDYDYSGIEFNVGLVGMF